MQTVLWLKTASHECQGIKFSLVKGSFHIPCSSSLCFPILLLLNFVSCVLVCVDVDVENKVHIAWNREMIKQTLLISNHRFRLRDFKGSTSDFAAGLE